MKEELLKAFVDAIEQYASLGVDAVKAIEQLTNSPYRSTAGRLMMYQDLKTLMVN